MSQYNGLNYYLRYLVSVFSSRGLEVVIRARNDGLTFRGARGIAASRLLGARVRASRQHFAVVIQRFKRESRQAAETNRLAACAPQKLHA